MRNIVVVPEGMSTAKVLQMMQHKRIQIAVVADEYGGTAGLVTMEDLLEEIVGDIQDEHDGEEAEDILRLGDDSYEFDGLVLLDEISELLNIEFDEPEEDTIGGFVFGLLGRKPEEGDRVVTGGWRFEVTEAEGFMKINFPRFFLRIIRINDFRTGVQLDQRSIRQHDLRTIPIIGTHTDQNLRSFLKSSHKRQS